jgi:hypothetical protein
MQKEKDIEPDEKFVEFVFSKVVKDFSEKFRDTFFFEQFTLTGANLQSDTHSKNLTKITKSTKE